MNKQAGFTLIELLTTCCILSLTGLFCAPLLSPVVNGIEFRSELRNIVYNLQQAKFEAIEKNSSVAVLFNQNGYSIFVDNGISDGIANNYIHEDGEKELIHCILNDKITLTENFSLNRIRFTGLPGNKVGTIIFTNNGGTKKSKVVLNRVGRIRVEKVF